MAVRTLDGIRAEQVETTRLATRVLFTGTEGGVPVLFLHGNLTSATWWEETMRALPASFRGIAPDQRGYGEADPQQKIDATRGTRDLMDDALALLDELGIDQAHVVGNSMGGSVIWPMLMSAPARFLSATLVSPGSPYGFGGTKDVDGTPCYADFAGSGGGLANRELIERIAAGDRGLESPFSPRAALRTLVYKPPFVPAREEHLLSAALKTHIGPQDVPGDSVASENWPYVAPGQWGLVNATSPKYAGVIDRLYGIEPMVSILWVRGSDDVAVSDAAASCPGALGAKGLLPNWPGPEVFPPQPMIGQTRAVLQRYAAAGGWYREAVIEDAGHVPFIEKPGAFNRVFHEYLLATNR
jgi:pimeloyl-ACP methyl ester carboxylesterase